jgi:hypothetical protein
VAAEIDGDADAGVAWALLGDLKLYAGRQHMGCTAMLQVVQPNALKAVAAGEPYEGVGPRTRL